MSTPRRWASVAIAWAMGFAAISFFWAAGGRWGLGTLASSLQEKAVRRDAGFVALVWATGALKLLVVPLVLALVRPWGSGVLRRTVVAAGWIVGALLVRDGGTGIITGVLAELGVVEPVDPSATRWYTLLWGPVWVAGSVAVLGTAWTSRPAPLSGVETTAEVVSTP